MKKAKFLRLASRGMFALLFMLIMLCSTETNAQSAETFDARIAQYTSLQETFAPGTAKYDVVGATVSYLEWVKAQYALHSDALYDTNPELAGGVGNAPQVRKSHRVILAEYSTSELVAFENQISSMSVDGVNPNAGVDINLFNKVKWIMEANAY